MRKLTADEARHRAGKIKLIVMDVDGVLTDGRIIYSADGKETKCFNVRDGHGIAMARMAGLEMAWISGRESKVTTLRAAELGVERVFQGRVDKLSILKNLTGECGVTLDETLFIGDDVVDIPAIEAAGLGVAVADAHPDTIASADWVTNYGGGRGAVREIIDLALTSRM